MSWVARDLVVHLMQQGVSEEPRLYGLVIGFEQAVRVFLGLLFALLPSTTSLV